MTSLLVAQMMAQISTGLIAGIFLGHRAGVSRASSRLSPECFIQLQQIIHQMFQRMMPPLVLASAISSIAWTVLLRAHGSAVAFWLLAVAALCVLVAAGLTRAVNIPINRQLMTWSSQKIPPDFSRVWRQWESIHSVRTILVLIAFLGQTVAAASSVRQLL